jgi:hypothetical protein
MKRFHVNVIRAFTSLPLASLQGSKLKAELDRIGRCETEVTG